MSFHLFHITELYSSADGRVQFIEFVGEANDERFWAGHSLISTNGAVTHSFEFPTDLPSASTAGRSVLVATQSFAALGLVKPDYVVPDGFLFTAGGTVMVPGMDQVDHGTLPNGGTRSVNDGGVVGTASPTNFAGATSTIPGNPIVGTPGANNLVGTAGSDYIVSLGGNDTLNGAAGADTMLGGAGNDTYVVASVGDRVYETTTVGGTINAGGIDTVRSSVTHTLGSFVEKLVLTGVNPSNGTGNALANSLTGNGAANLLSGAAGADTMLGGAGNDTYVVASVGDRVYETTTVGGTINAGGTDTVRSSVTYTLGSFVEKLVLAGVNAINGTGNALANSLTGNGAANVLKGANGNDVLVGGGGADTLYGDGNSDLLRGGAGNDILYGGSGNDRFRFDTALSTSTVKNVDQIKDFNPIQDTIQLENSIFTKFGTSTTGAINPAFFRANTTGLAQDGNDYIIYETDTGKLFYDSNGSAAGGSVQIALLGASLSLTNGDYVLV